MSVFSIWLIKHVLMTDGEFMNVNYDLEYEQYLRVK